MRPVEISITNFRSFRSETKLDFRGLSVFAVIGDTGAGKTSILEAITYALFNRPTWDGRGTKELIADGANAMKVVFVFAVNGVEYTVVRNTRRVGTAQHRLFASAIDLDASSEAEVNAAITHVLGMDADTFLHTILLPQGEHARLLTATDSKKNEILDSLYGLNILRDIDSAAKRLKDQGAALVDATKKLRDRFPADPHEPIASAEAELRECDEALRTAETAAKTMKDLTEQLSRREREVENGQARLQLFEGLGAAIDRLSDLRKLELPLALDNQKAVEMCTGTRDAVSAAEAELTRLEDAGVDFASLRAVSKLLDDLERESRERASDVVQGEDLSSRLAAVGKEAASASAALQDCETEASANSVSLQAIADQAKKAGAFLEALTAALASRDSALELSNASEAQYENAKRTSAALHEELATAKIAASACDANLSMAREAHEGAKTTHAAAQLAEHLHAGDDCPVCQRRLPTKFIAPKSADLAAAKKAEEEARRAAVQANEKVQTLTERLRAAVAAENAAKDASADATSKLSSAVANIDYCVMGKSGSAREIHEAAASTLADLDAERRQLEVVGAEIQGRSSALKQRSAALIASSTELRRQLDEVTSRSATRGEKCAALAKALPPNFFSESDGSGIPSARLAVEKALALANEVQLRLEDARRADYEANARVMELQALITKEISVPRAALVSKLRDYATRLQVAPIPDNVNEHEAWAFQAQAILDSRIDVEKAIQIATADIEAKLAARAAIAAQLGTDPENAVINRSVNKAKAEARVAQTKDEAKQVADLDAEIDRVTPARQGLDDLCNILKGTQFKAYARIQRQKRLLAQASLVLKTMTDGQYEFSSEFRIIDHWTNEVRSADSLSGGEQFLGSLALSLALVDIHASAGKQIESLFLDEGFNALDAVSLDRAMTELRRRSRAPYNHLIGVISHVKEVTQYVNRTFRMDKSTDGSKVTLIDGDVDEEASVARGLVSQLLA